MKSDTFTSNIGIKQGCTLSCLIFALYLNDLDDTLKHNNCKGLVIGQDVNLSLMLKLVTLLYADQFGL